MRHFCTIAAAATSLMLASASAANAAIITDGFELPDDITATLLNDGNPLEIEGFGSFSAFFNQANDGFTSFNDVFGSFSNPNVQFSFTFADAAGLALQPLAAGSAPAPFFPGGSDGLVPSADLGPVGPAFLGLQAFAGVRISSLGSVGGLSDVVGNEFSGSGFLTFKAAPNPSHSSTAVPTPALLPGLIGMGVAAFRKRNSAQSDEA